jgi:hypothetical protein
MATAREHNDTVVSSSQAQGNFKSNHHHSAVQVLRRPQTVPAQWTTRRPTAQDSLSKGLHTTMAATLLPTSLRTTQTYALQPLVVNSSLVYTLGLSAFALTTFVLSLINVNTRSIGHPNIVVALAYGYGGLVQLLAGMWYVLLYNA